MKHWIIEVQDLAAPIRMTRAGKIETGGFDALRKAQRQYLSIRRPGGHISYLIGSQAFATKEAATEERKRLIDLQIERLKTHITNLQIEVVRLHKARFKS